MKKIEISARQDHRSVNYGSNENTSRLIRDKRFIRCTSKLFHCTVWEKEKSRFDEEEGKHDDEI